MRRLVLPFAAAAISLAVLAGCTPTDGDGDPSTAPTDGAGETAVPTPEPTDAPTSTPIDATCDELVSPDTLYVYNPNFSLVEDFTPATGSAAASALTYEGVACRWENQTNGEIIDLAVAQLDDETLTALKNTAFEESQMVPTYGEEAYFAVEDSVGVARVFQGPYWIVLESPVFFEPGDATEIVQAVLAGLGA